MVWGSDWPHPTEKEKPDDAVLFDLLGGWAPDEATRRRILVDNPAKLYGFEELNPRRAAIGARIVCAFERAVRMQHHRAGVAHRCRNRRPASTSTSWPADISWSIRWPSKRASIRRLVCVEPQVRPSSQRGASIASSSGWR